MIDWAHVRDAGYAAPQDRPLDELVAELIGMLRSPDPVVRDLQGYAVLANWIRRGELSNEQLRAVGDELVPRFGDPEIQARTFVPLILDSIVSAGVFEPAWVPPFERWYVAEEDLRGYDGKLGWLHAVAHGSDLLGGLGLVPPGEPLRMLELGIGRLLKPTEYVLRDLEDDRLGSALAATLTRTDLTEADAVAWLEPAIRGVVLGGGEPGIRPEVSNTLGTVRMVYLLGDRGRPLPGAKDPVAVMHRDAVRARLVEVFRAATPYFFAAI